MPTLAWIHHGPSRRLFKMRPHYPKNPSFRVARLSNHLAVANALLDVDLHVCTLSSSGLTARVRSAKRSTGFASLVKHQLMRPSIAPASASTILGKRFSTDLAHCDKYIAVKE
jgi:hypothetical protein